MRHTAKHMGDRKKQGNRELAHLSSALLLDVLLLRLLLLLLKQLQLQLLLLLLLLLEERVLHHLVAVVLQERPGLVPIFRPIHLTKPAEITIVRIGTSRMETSTLER